MTDKKLTDNEIKKALECCYSKGNWCVSGCPRMYCCDTVTECRMELNKDALDLINRLQAENERLKKSNRNWRRKVQRLRADFADLNVDLEGYASEYANKIKAEAYKECAEKIKQKTLAMIYSPDEISTDDYIKCIDDVVKELEGDNDGT